MRVLMICPELPKSGDPGSMAPASRQFESLRRLGIDLEVVDMSGIPKLKYLTAMARHSQVEPPGRLSPRTLRILRLVGKDRQLREPSSNSIHHVLYGR